ncbi:MAG: hypothetical protein Q9204_005613 [Flavoplaca sp. TL-2023a]
MRKGRPHPTINGIGQKRSPEEAKRVTKQQKRITDPDSAQSREGAEQGRTVAGMKSPAAQQSPPRQPTAMPYRARKNPTTSALSDSSSCSSRIETLSPSTDSNSPDTLSPSTKASSVTPATDHDDNDNDINAWASKATLNTQNDIPSSVDCAGIAMQSLQDLTSASNPQLLDPNSNTTLDNLLHTASSCIKHLSAILICPCSRNPNIGLLNAALCAAILDTYWNILYQAVDTSSTDCSSEIENMMTGSLNPVFSSHNNHGHQPATIIQRVLDELPKAANVVMQFSRRYAPSGEATLAGSGIGGGKGDMVDLLPILANEQRVRLKGMVDKATDLMALGV